MTEITAEVEKVESEKQEEGEAREVTKEVQDEED